MAGLQVVTIQAPSQGMDTDSAPAHVSNQRAPLVQNCLPARNGRLPARGGGKTVNGVAVTRLDVSQGPWTFDDYVLLPANDTVQGTRVDLTSFTITPFETYDPLRIPRYIWLSHARIGDYVYGIGTDGALPEMNSPTIIRWDGGATAGTSLLTYTNAPRGGVAVKNHLDRLFMLASGTTSALVRANNLYWSDIGGPTADTADMWDEAGFQNKIELPKDGEWCVGLAAAGRSLLILRTRSLWMLTGDTPDTFALRRVASVGASNVGTIVEFNDGVFFTDSQNQQLYYFDGASVARASDQMRTYRFMRAARLDDEYLILSTAYAPGDGDKTTRSAFLFHVPSKSWSKFSSDSMMGTPAWLGRTKTYPFCVEGSFQSGSGVLVNSRVWTLNNTTSPELDPNNRVDTVASGSSSVVPARVTTRCVKLGSPVERAMLRQIIFDYDLSANGAVVNVLDLLWRVTVTDTAGTTLYQNNYGSSANPGRQRAAIDIYAEVSDTIQIDIQLLANGPRAMSSAEIQDITVVYQTTRQRES